ncbi:MAG TPA: S26 family signal peptidase [Steroidobacteraceae bacterium]|nr:S26 family signal peptidase [Steroidobacteraceae bacterium]
MKHKRIITLLVVLMATLALLLSPHLQSPYRFLYNPSESAPRGWYVVMPIKKVRVNDFVVVRLPQEPATLAAQRGYLPLTVPLLKHVAGIRGQRACSTADALLLDDRVVARSRNQDGAGRTLTPWLGCRTLAADEVLLLSTTSDASFDSRYFGPVHRSAILGRAIPVWTW